MKMISHEHTSLEENLEKENAQEGDAVDKKAKEMKETENEAGAQKFYRFMQKAPKDGNVQPKNVNPEDNNKDGTPKTVKEASVQNSGGGFKLNYLFSWWKVSYAYNKYCVAADLFIMLFRNKTLCDMCSFYRFIHYI